MQLEVQVDYKENPEKICEKSQEIVQAFNRLNYIQGEISKLERAKARAYDDFSNLMIKHLRTFKEIDIDSESVIVCYHKDKGIYGQTVGVNGKILESAISQSRITKLPVIITLSQVSVITTNQDSEKPHEFIPVINKGSYLDRTCRKICSKLDNVILNIQKLRSESESIFIDPEEKEALTYKMNELHQKCKRRCEFIDWNNGEAREMRAVLQERYEKKREKSKEKIKLYERTGIPFDFLRKIYYDPKEVKRMLDLKPDFKNYLSDDDIAQLVEGSLNIDNLDHTITCLSEKSDSFNNELKKIEGLAKELQQIVV